MWLAVVMHKLPVISLMCLFECDAKDFSIQHFPKKHPPTPFFFNISRISFKFKGDGSPSSWFDASTEKPVCRLAKVKASLSGLSEQQQGGVCHLTRDVGSTANQVRNNSMLNRCHRSVSGSVSIRAEKLLINIPKWQSQCWCVAARYLICAQVGQCCQGRTLNVLRLPDIPGPKAITH